MKTFSSRHPPQGISIMTTPNTFPLSTTTATLTRGR